MHFQRDEVSPISEVVFYTGHVSPPRAHLSQNSTVQSRFECDVKQIQDENLWWKGIKWSMTEDIEVNGKKPWYGQVWNDDTFYQAEPVKLSSPALTEGMLI